MAYVDLLEEEGINSQYLCVIKPRRQANGSWALVSGSLYTRDFSLGGVVSLLDNGVLLTEASTSALSDGDWFYDPDDETIYYDTGSDANTRDLVATYEIYVGTFDAHFHRDPLDTGTRVVYYEPLIIKSPVIKQSTSDSLFGFLPTQTSNITLSNVTQFFQEHVYESSFNLVELKLYHYLDELIPGNVKLVSVGRCGNLSYDDRVLQIAVFDANHVFDTEFRHPSGSSFYGTSEFGQLDPNFDARPIRRVFGVVDGFIPVNIDYNDSNPTTSDNRTWSCINPHTDLGSVSATVSSSPSSTSSRTYLDSADGFRVGDSVWIDSNAGPGTDEFPIVTAVNKVGDHYIEHDTITNVAVNPDVVKRSFVGSVTIVQNAVTYTARYGRDYVEYTDAGPSVAGFNFTTTLESNLSMPAVLTPLDLVHARIYGPKNTSTLGGGSFGSNSELSGNLGSSVVILWEVMKTILGLSESELDNAAFTSLEASITSILGFAVPKQANNDFPVIKDLLAEISVGELIKLSQNDVGEYTITQTGPVGSVDKSIEDDEILDNSFKYTFNYLDIISDVIVEYAGSEVNQRNEQGSELSYLSVRQESDLAKRLHGIQKQRSFQSYHILASDAQALANRLSFALGDRSGIIALKTKNRFFNSEINDAVQVTREKLPGFEFVSGTDRNRTSAVISTDKNLDEIKITLDDQKGIEDNSGSW